MDTEKDKKPVKLTKRGIPDRRAESSKKNLEKGKSIIKEALKQIKNKKIEQPDVKIKEDKENKEDSSDDYYSTDEEEIDLEEDSKNIEVNTPSMPSMPSTYEFTFEKKLNEQIDKLNSEYNLKISDMENKTKKELDILKKQNLELKKHLTNNFRTHSGVLNQEMFLKF